MNKVIEAVISLQSETCRDTEKQTKAITDSSEANTEATRNELQKWKNEQWSYIQNCNKGWNMHKRTQGFEDYNANSKRNAQIYVGLVSFHQVSPLHKQIQTWWVIKIQANIR